MSDTPRTDAFCEEATDAIPGDYKALIPNWIDFARILERENATLTAEVEQARESAQQYMQELYDVVRKNDALEAEVERKQAALELLVDKAQHFYAMVKGECPSLLEDDHNTDNFTDALDAARRAVLPVTESANAKP